MKIISLIFISIFLIIVFIMSCNLEVNTSDAQASSDIKSSKQNGFFISEYKPSVIPQRIFKISEVWMESIWFNRIYNGRVVREKSNGIQLNFKLTEFSNSEFADDKYLLNWRMKDDHENSVGKGNGVYTFFFENEVVPDTIHISILKIKQDRTTIKICEFLLFKEK